MSIENAKAFIKKINTESSLKEKVSGKDLNQASKIAAKIGFDCTKQELIETLHAHVKKSGISLTEEELSNINGGCTPMTMGASYSCNCLSH